jgi:hypothetical protein
MSRVCAKQIIRRSCERFVRTKFAANQLGFFDCSLSNSRWAKAHTAAFRGDSACDLILRVFNDLDSRPGLARQVPIDKAEIAGNKPDLVTVSFEEIDLCSMAKITAYLTAFPFAS